MVVARKRTREEMKTKVLPDYMRVREGVVPVSDNWYPTTNGVVRLTMHKYQSSGVCVLSAWGGDDFGMEAEAPNEHAATSLFDLLLGAGVLTQKDFRDMGFTPC